MEWWKIDFYDLICTQIFDKQTAVCPYKTLDLVRLSLSQPSLQQISPTAGQSGPELEKEGDPDESEALWKPARLVLSGIKKHEVHRVSEVFIRLCGGAANPVLGWSTLSAWQSRMERRRGSDSKIFTVINGAFWRRSYVLPTDIHTPASPEVKSPEICREAAEQHGQFWKWMRHKAERSCVIFMVQCFFRLLCGFIRFIVGGGKVWL